MEQKPNYKTWIRTKKIIILMAISIIILLLLIVINNIAIKLMLLLLLVVFGYILLIIGYSAYKFSDLGGNYQKRIHVQLIDYIEPNDELKILDIGAGNGSLVNKVAKRFKDATVTGIDFWGKEWEYSKSVCDANAKIENVQDRVNFIKASASQLPFENNQYDVVVSCLTFHEVLDTDDKYKVIDEAFRVLNDGGQFIFLDLFYDEKFYGDKGHLNQRLAVMELKKYELLRLEDVIELDYILKHKKVLGNAVILKGVK